MSSSEFVQTVKLNITVSFTPKVLSSIDSDSLYQFLVRSLWHKLDNHIKHSILKLLRWKLRTTYRSFLYIMPSCWKKSCNSININKLYSLRSIFKIYWWWRIYYTSCIVISYVLNNRFYLNLNSFDNHWRNMRTAHIWLDCK